MKKNTLVSLSDFVDKIYTLKALTRYNNKFKIINESVAEHSYFVAVLVLKMHDDYNFNLEEALKMALIHDIPELHLSDVTHDVKRNFPKLAQEVTNAEYVIMKQKYPQWFTEFKKFEDQETVEALVVKMADNLSCVQYATAEIMLGNKGYMKEVATSAATRVMQCEVKLKKWRRKNAKK
jgi:5'-deoxynucleotidase YfbR-like HD superfamily hydrolase